MSETLRSVLQAVKEQARLLKERRPSDPAAWTQQQWWEAFVYLVRSAGSAAGVFVVACASTANAPHRARPPTTPSVTLRTPSNLQFVNAGGGYCSNGQHQDDLLFFVRAAPRAATPAPSGSGRGVGPAQQQPRSNGAGGSGSGGGSPAAAPPSPAGSAGPGSGPVSAAGPGTAAQGPGAPHRESFFVRRRAAELPEDLRLSGGAFASVDWAASVLLNTVLHSRYQLTVVACGCEGCCVGLEGRRCLAFG
jgi:hypothetical protein